MRNLNGNTFGKWSLRIDAMYCTLLGLAVALGAGAIADSVRLHPGTVALTGVAVVVWAGGILWMLARLPLRRALRFVTIANICAAIVVAIASFSAATILVVLAVIAVAIDIALFAASQAFALGALRSRA